MLHPLVCYNLPPRFYVLLKVVLPLILNSPVLSSDWSVLDEILLVGICESNCLAASLAFPILFFLDEQKITSIALKNGYQIYF